MPSEGEVTTTVQTLSETTEWVTPFPEGDPLNDPWFRDNKYVFPTNETVLVSFLLALNFYSVSCVSTVSFIYKSYHRITSK